MAVIDLSRLPAPAVVEPLDYETILAAAIADLQARDPEFSASVESDPAYKILEVYAYRELLLRQRINDAARATMLAYATSSDLDHLVALLGVERLLVTPADPAATPPVAAVYEDDARLRYRAQMALEGMAAAGPTGAYRFHALSASADVRDVSIDSPEPGVVRVTVLSINGDGTPDAGLLSAVEAYLSAEDRRPLCDTVRIAAPAIIPFELRATLHLGSGPSPALIRDAAEAAAMAYISTRAALGHAVTLSGLYAALHQPGVTRVELVSPAADVEVAATAVAYCTGRSITIGAGNV